VDTSALPALLLPAAAVWAARWAFARRAGPAGFEVAVAVVAAVAILAALFLAGVRPGPDGWTRLVWIVPAGAAVGIATLAPLPALARALLRAGGAFATAALLAGPLGRNDLLLPGTLGVLCLWSLSGASAAEERRRAVSASLLVAAAATPVVLLRGAHSVYLAAIAATVAATLWAAALSPRRGVVAIARPLGGIVATGLGGVLLAAHAYQGQGDFPAASAASMAAAAVVGAFVPLRWGRWAPWSAAGAALVGAALSAWTSGTFEPYDVWW
jgi:hypothetical protein